MEKSKWTEDQKKLLLAYVRSCRRDEGQIDWDAIAAHLPFTAKQCYVQFNNLRRRDALVQSDEVLNKRYNHQWTRAEEVQLLELASQYYRNWDYIKRIAFPYLTAYKIKNKYAMLARTEEAYFTSNGEVPAPRVYKTRKTQHAADTNSISMLAREAANDIALSTLATLPDAAYVAAQTAYLYAQLAAQPDLAQIMGYAPNVVDHRYQGAVQASFMPGTLYVQDFNLLKDLNEMSAIDSARLFIMDSARY